MSHVPIKWGFGFCTGAGGGGNGGGGAVRCVPLWDKINFLAMQAAVKSSKQLTAMLGR